MEPAKVVERLEVVFKGWYDCSAEGGGERGKSGEGLSEVRQIRVSGRGSGDWLSSADLLVLLKDEPDRGLVGKSRAGGVGGVVGGKRPERGWLVGGVQGEKRGEEGERVKRV